MNETSPHPIEGIAIVGLAGKFPGADDVAAFWQRLVQAEEGIATIDKTKLGPEEPSHDPDYVPRRGTITQPEWFDAAFFGMSPKEAEATDPQQRLFLEACWHALEDAAIDPSRSAGPIGVYAGMSNNSYFPSQIEFNADLRQQVGAEMVMIGNEKDYLATRVAYKLNLRGPALNIYTACSTSLVAVCQAVSGLQTYQCDVALAGGVSVKFPQERGYLYQEGSIFSVDGHCRSFDEKAQGTVFSNGLGVVVLKRAEDAVRDGDRIYAIIKGAALNNDGAEKSSFTAPSVGGHAEVISLAQALADIDPDTIDYIEAHGTATPIGDPIEIAGLTEAFRAGGCTRTNFCALGSAKSNFGHLDAAAGVTGLIKTALALYHRTIPASLHFTKPNPVLGLEQSPFFVNAKTTPWERQGHPRRAGVSSFGVGGTNAHVVLEEAPEVIAQPTKATPQILVLSAKTEAALQAQRAQLVSHLQAHPDLDLAAAATTLQVGRQAFNHRLACSASTVAEAIAALQGAAGKDYFTQLQPQRNVPLAFLFPGQGSQHLRMGAALAEAEPAFKTVVDECAELLHPLLGFDLRTLLTPAANRFEETERQLAETRYTQPALFVIEYALAKLLGSWGLHPSIMLGHSVGEYVAACLAGVMSLADALQLVTIRGRLLWDCEPGAMLGVRATEATVTSLLLPGVDLAAVNSPNLVVISGSHEQITAMEAILAREELSCRRLVTSHAFHSMMMESALEKFRQALTEVTLSPPQIPYVSNVTGRHITDAEATDPNYYLQHIRKTVRFAEGVATLLESGPIALLEVGPGQALATLARQQPAIGQATTVLSSLPPAKAAGMDEVAEVHRMLGRLWLGGVAVDWSALSSTNASQRVTLPGYPFQRQPYCATCVLPIGTIRIGESALLPGLTAGSVPTVIVSPTPAETNIAEISRQDHLLAELRTQLHQASGLDLSAAPAAASFFDLGFDSLFLTQASIFLRKYFGVRITFRQMAEELGCLEALATYLDAQLPPDKFQPTITAALLATAVSANSPAGDRLAIIEQAIGDLRRDLLKPPVSAAKKYSVRALSQQVNSDKRIPFGPFRPLQTAKDGSLTEQQRAHLDELLTAYVARTKGSKSFTQQHRHHFADPRAVAGFNHLWKEAVYPLIVDRSLGGRIWDVDGNEYIDITQGFGVGFLGHRAPFVIAAVQAQLERGVEIGPTNPLVGEVAELFLEFTGHDRVSFCNTGSEALMAAIRTSRTVTGRDKIVMFAGAYHGIMDEVLVRPMMDGDQLHTIPIAPGIPAAVGENILVLDFDNPESLEIIRDHASEIAAVLVETVQSRRPELQPAEFLHTLRAITAEHGIALVLDEVVNGFRIHPRGAAGYFGIEADIATYGKIVGGGFPIGIVAGKRKYLDALDGGFWQYGDDSGPEVGVTFFAGTFVRHPLSLAAAKAVLLHLKEKGPGLQTWMNQRTTAFVEEINAFCQEVGAPIRLTHFSSYYFVNFAPQLKYTELLFLHLRLRGIHAWAGRSSFFCTQHTDEDIAQIVACFKASVQALQAAGFIPTKADPAAVVPEQSSELEVVATFMPSYAPLTSSQQELLLASSLSESASTACHESVTVKLSGALQPEILHQALGLLIERHVALRASFDQNGEGMHIAANVRLPLPLLDLSDLNAAEQEQRLLEICRQQLLQPFALNHGPMLRAALVTLSPTEHRLLLTAHHIICDGWSFGVLLNELPEAYRLALSQGHFSTPAPRFDAYAAEERLLRASGEGSEAKTYWLQKLARPPAPLALPTDHARAELSYDTFSVGLSLPKELLEEVKQLAKERRLTVFHILLGTWQLLLHRLTGQTDFLVGVPFAGQASSGEIGLVGHCVQFLPLRAKLNPDVTGLSFLEQVGQEVMGAMDHQACTLGEILQELKGISAAERQQFVPTAFSLESISGDPIEAAGVTFTTQLNPKLRSAFQLTLYAYQSATELRLLCAARSQLFREETIQRWLRHYERLLQSLCAKPETPLARLPMLTAEQRTELIHGFNAHGRRAGGDVCLHAWFEQQATQHPQSLALTCDHQSLTYGEVNARANQLAHALIQAGIRPGMLVGLCLERANHLVIAILGILKAGAAYVPMDLSYPSARLAFMLEDAAVSVLVTQQSLVNQLPAHQGQNLLLDSAVTDFPTTNPQTAVTPDDTAYVIYTSGSTGKPKGCRISHRNVARLMQSTEAWFHFNARDVWTLFHSAAFDFSVWEIWGALLYGGRLVIVPFELSRSPDEFLDLIIKEQVTVLNQTPSAFKQLMAAEAAATVATKLPLRYVIFGGEALEMASLKPWFARHGDQQPQLVNMYGITETTVHVTYRPLTAADTKGGSVIGVPIPDLQIYLLDPVGEPVPFGTVGELYVGGDGLAQGYLNRPELTAERFLPDHLSGRPGAKLYRTGDLGRFRPGRELEYLGRADFQVKIRGFRIELGEIESVLLTHPDVRDAAVLARQTAEGDAYLAAYIVYDQDLPTHEGLRRHLKAKLPDYMVPASFACLTQFPLTENGKLDRLALPVAQVETTVSATELPQNYISPRTDFEKRLGEIWQEILRIPAVGAEDNFFEIGGTSLHGLRLFTRIRSDFQVALPLATLFRAPTLEKLAATIETVANATRGKVSPLTCIQPAGDALPFFGLHGGDGGAMFYKGLLARFGNERPFYAIESPALVDESLPIESQEIAAVAAEYIALMRLAQRRGPYLLGGYSYGGIVAYEMAQQLLAAGDEVPLLVLFDTENPNVPAREYSLGERIAVSWRTSQSNNVAGKLLQLGGRFSSGIIQRLRTEAETASARRLLKQGIKADDERLRYVQIREANILALETYQAKPLATTVLLFRSDEASDKFDLSEDYGWTSLVDRLIIDRVTGNHLDIFDEPHVSAIGDKLRRHLADLVANPMLA